MSRIHHPNGHAEAQKATFYSKEDKLILEDDPKVETDNAVLSGRRIVTNLGQDRNIMVEGMADAIFNPNGKPITNMPASGKTNGPAGSGGSSARGSTGSNGTLSPVAGQGNAPMSGPGNSPPPGSGGTTAETCCART